ncbi:A/G-specific adenine glycosylase [Oecophyllibacter saccharovorans]|uniref:A/G-specific adenine glycosylase n=1 Tax=Oecophyllibacter saccharovorans TaxID=2558360 RepID=UPI001F5034CF|nr:A/G-specific adenine glycosylase [Oecophyllibacter saccharovorans]
MPALERTLDPDVLLAWYDRHGRTLPWRLPRGGKPADGALSSSTPSRPEPYRVWLSEIMLQQTTVSTVIPYYERFLSLFPTLEALAQAPLETVLHNWAGLGYYSRARNLHACARALAEQGGFPADPDSLRKLPGIGPYTAHAISAIAFGLPVIPVDGNVERILARLAAVAQPLPGARPLLARLGEQLGERLASAPRARHRASDFAQALFDLGATICTPRAPSCLHCPWRESCRAQAGGLAENLPARQKKKPRPVRYGVAFRVRDAQGEVLLRRRPAQGLLGGMDELPGTPWHETPWEEATAFHHAPLIQMSGTPEDPPAAGQPRSRQGQWVRAGEIKHVFTHFTLMLTVYDWQTQDALPSSWPEGLQFHPPARATLSGMLKKCLAVLVPTPAASPSSLTRPRKILQP